MLGRLWRAIVNGIVQDDPDDAPEKPRPAVSSPRIQDLRRPSRPMVKKLVELTDIKVHLVRSIDELSMTYALPWVASLPASEQEELFRKYSVSERDADDILFRAYSGIYSATEIMDMIAFFKSRTGQKMVKTSSRVAHEVSAAAQDKAGSLAMCIIKEGIRRSDP